MVAALNTTHYEPPIDRGRVLRAPAGLLGYEIAARSRFFTDLNFDLLAAHMAMPDQDDAVRAYRDRLRSL